MLRQQFIIALLGIGAVAAYPTPSAALPCSPKPPYLQKNVGGSTQCIRLGTSSVELEANVASTTIDDSNTVDFQVTPQATAPEAADDESGDDIVPTALTRANAQTFMFPRALALCQNNDTLEIKVRIRRSAVGTFSNSGVCIPTVPGECQAIVVASPVPEEDSLDLTATIASQSSAPTPCNSNETLIDYVPKALVAEATFTQPGLSINQQVFCKLKQRLRSLVVMGEEGLFIKKVDYKCTPLP